MEKEEKGGKDSEDGKLTEVYMVFMSLRALSSSSLIALYLNFWVYSSSERPKVGRRVEEKQMVHRQRECRKQGAQSEKKKKEWKQGKLRNTSIREIQKWSKSVSNCRNNKR